MGLTQYQTKMRHYRQKALMDNFAGMDLIGLFNKVINTNLDDLPEKDALSTCPIMAQSLEKSVVIARFSGSIGLDKLAEFSATLNNLITDSVMRVILDFSSSSISRTALGALISFAAAMHGRNKRLYIYKPGEKLLVDLAELELKGYFVFLRSQEEALLKLVV